MEDGGETLEGKKWQANDGKAEEVANVGKEGENHGEGGGDR